MYLLYSKTVLVFIFHISDCSMVHNECLECSGEASDDCARCSDSFYLAGGICVGKYCT